MCELKFLFFRIEFSVGVFLNAAMNIRLWHEYQLLKNGTASVFLSYGICSRVLIRVRHPYSLQLPLNSFHNYPGADPTGQV